MLLDEIGEGWLDTTVKTKQRKIKKYISSRCSFLGGGEIEKREKRERYTQPLLHWSQPN